MPSITHETRLYINGQLVPAQSGATYPNISPSTEEVLGVNADAGEPDMQAAIAAARKAFDTSDWSTNHAKRLEWMKKFVAGIRANKELFRQIVMAEAGQPYLITETAGLVEPLEHLDWIIEHMQTITWRRELEPVQWYAGLSKRAVFKESVGVVGAITPWNYPMVLNLTKCMTALAAGCTVILKPAPDTPWSATQLGKIAHDIGLPAGVFNVVTAQHPATVGEVLVKSPDVDMISFTGSTNVGKHIMKLGSDTVKKIFLELGGKSALILLDDADFNIGAFMAYTICAHAGQGCAMTTRVLVPRTRYQEFLDLTIPLFQSAKCGLPTDTSVMCGPVVNKNQYERMLRYIEIGKAEGATLAAGGGRAEYMGDKGYFIQPTLFTNVTNNMRIAQEEIFGPIQVVIPYEDDEEAIRIANDSVYGLSGNVQSKNLERAMKVASRIRSGTIAVNNGKFFCPDMPFGGYKQSGVGREMGPEGFEEYLHTKSVGYTG